MLSFKKFFIALLSLTSVLSAQVHNHLCGDSKIRNKLDGYGAQIGKNYKLKLIASGLGSIAGDRKAVWGLLFTCPEKVTLQDGQVLVKELSTKLFEKLYQDPIFDDYVVTEQKTNQDHPPLSSLSLAYRIDFWDENVNRQNYPYLAEIRYAEGKYYFYYADPKTGALQEPVLVESASGLDKKSL